MWIYFNSNDVNQKTSFWQLNWTSYVWGLLPYEQTNALKQACHALIEKDLQCPWASQGV